MPKFDKKVRSWSLKPETGFYLCPFRVTILVKQTTNIRKLNGTQKFPVQFAKWNLKLQRYVMYSVFQFRIQARNKTLCLCSKIRNTNACPLVKFKCWYQMFRSFIVEGNKKISLNFCYKFQCDCGSGQKWIFVSVG